MIGLQPNDCSVSAVLYPQNVNGVKAATVFTGCPPTVGPDSCLGDNSERS